MTTTLRRWARSPLARVALIAGLWATAAFAQTCDGPNPPLPPCSQGQVIPEPFTYEYCYVCVERCEQTSSYTAVEQDLFIFDESCYWCSEVHRLDRCCDSPIGLWCDPWIQGY